MGSLIFIQALDGNEIIPISSQSLQAFFQKAPHLVKDFIIHSRQSISGSAKSDLKTCCACVLIGEIRVIADIPPNLSDLLLLIERNPRETPKARFRSLSCHTYIRCRGITGADARPNESKAENRVQIRSDHRSGPRQMVLRDSIEGNQPETHDLPFTAEVRDPASRLT